MENRSAVGPLAVPAAGRFRLALVAITVLALTVGLVLRLVDQATARGAVASTITVDFTKTIATVPATDIGATVSGYGGDTTVANSEAHQELLRKLGVGLLRIELRYEEPGNGQSKVVCNSLGCEKGISGADWLKGIKAVGAEPMLVLPTDPEHSAETDVKDAVNLAKFAADQGVPVTRFVVGNEPDYGGNQKKLSAEEYTKRFNMIADALHAANAEYQVGGPTLANAIDPGVPPKDAAVLGFTDTFLRNSGAKADFFDFHHYNQCEETPSEEEALTERVRRYRMHIDKVRAQIKELVPARADRMGIQLGEFNVVCDRKEPRALTHLATLGGAAVLGTILATDANAIQFSDRNEGLGLVSDAGHVQPIYHGIGMFTGEGLFRRFGTKMVEAKSENDALFVFASTDAKNVVIVNTAKEAADTSIAFTGLADTEAKGDVWQSTGDKMTPHKTGDLAIAGGKATLEVPARSVMTLVIDPGTGQPAPTETTTTTTVPATTTTVAGAPAGEGAGLTAEYFDNPDLTGKTHKRVEPRVYLDYEHAPFEDFEADTWSARWTGAVLVDALGTYTFTTTSDDGVRLWIDDSLVVDKWDAHTIRDDAGQVALTPGWHTVKLEFHDQAEIAFLKLSWQGPGLEREVVPSDHLKPVAATQ